MDDHKGNVLELMFAVIRTLVDDEGAVQIACHVEDDVTTMKVHVATPDVGKIIGKQGRTARSLRTVLSAVGAKLGHRYSLDIADS